jgi:cytochrome c oxidase cbb3-type subunit 3
MKFIHYLESISGVGIYPLLGIILFVTFFLVMLLVVFKADKKLIDKFSNIPLEQ